MPDLTIEEARELRKRPVKECQKCGAQIWGNYCRQHDYFFEDGQAAVLTVVAAFGAPEVLR